MKGIDFKHFKKVSEDEHVAVLKHADGHEIHIAKKALSKPMQEQLGKLKTHMAEGGQANPKLEESAKKLVSKPVVQQDPVKTQNAQDSMRKAFHFADGGETPSSDELLRQQFYQQQGETAPPVETQAPEDVAPPGQLSPHALQVMSGNPAPVSNTGTQLSEPEQVGAAQEQPKKVPDTLGYEEMASTTRHGIGQEMAGLAGEAQATAAQGQREVAAADQAIAAQQHINKQYQTNLQALDNERQAFLQDVQNQHIDPSHYMESMSTGQKFATAIGLIAAGLTGGGEHAVQFINNQIDRDINAQKAELGKKENLLNANLRQFGNLNDAVNMTRVMQADIMASKMKAAAARTVDPMAKARLMQQAGELEIKYAPLMQQTAMRSALMSGMANVPPEAKIQFVIPKEQHAEAFKEMKDAKANMKLRDLALSTFDQLNKESLAGRLHPGARNALIEPLTAILGKELAGRYTAADAKTFIAALPEAGDSSRTRTVKRQNMNNLINSKDNYSVLTSVPGIDLLPQGQYDRNGQPRIQFTPTVK